MAHQSALRCHADRPQQCVVRLSLTTCPSLPVSSFFTVGSQCAGELSHPRPATQILTSDYTREQRMVCEWWWQLASSNINSDDGGQRQLLGR
ncbi:unnamed protein product [Citrullus colocynthis]|uniref:Uncharacterized protein n=1 Tax=Citrullus colocynthis TaxID=252529 RepID=A0ABP0Z789_9ROSI